MFIKTFSILIHKCNVNKCVAFANFGTGKILFGISDDGSICGIDNPDQRCLDIENKIEILSQGGLPSGISKDEYLNGNI